MDDLHLLSISDCKALLNRHSKCECFRVLSDSGKQRMPGISAMKQHELVREVARVRKFHGERLGSPGSNSPSGKSSLAATQMMVYNSPGSKGTSKGAKWRRAFMETLREDGITQETGVPSKDEFQGIVRNLFREGVMDREDLQCALTSAGEDFRRKATELCLVEGCLLFDEPADVRNMAKEMLQWTLEDWDLAAGVGREAGRHLVLSRLKWLKDTVRAKLIQRGERYGASQESAASTEELEMQPLGAVNENIQKLYKEMIDDTIAALNRKCKVLQKEHEDPTKATTSPATRLILDSLYRMRETELGSSEPGRAASASAGRSATPGDNSRVRSSSFERLHASVTEFTRYSASTDERPELLREPQRAGYLAVLQSVQRSSILPHRNRLITLHADQIRREIALRGALCRKFSKTMHWSYRDSEEDPVPGHDYDGRLEELATKTATLRAHMQGQVTALGELFSRGDVLLQIPTGCGKTGLICLLPYAYSSVGCRRVLVIAPNLEIRKKLFKNLSGLDPDDPPTDPNDRRHAFLINHGVLASANDLPSVLEWGDSCRTMKDAEVVVSNIQKINQTALLEKIFDRTYFDLLIFDEGHHTVAGSYATVRQYFRTASCVMLTATPYRSDEIGMAARTIYKFPIQTAIRSGYIKNIFWDQVPIESMTLSHPVTRNTRTTLNISQIKRTAENEVNFRREVGQVMEDHGMNSCVDDTMHQAMARLRQLRLTSNIRHCCIGKAKTVQDAQILARLWNIHPENQGDFKVGWISADGGGTPECVGQQHNTREQVKRALGVDIDVIINVNLLNEGFDMPLFSVGVFFHPVGSMGPFVQFVGRSVRRLNSANSGVQEVAEEDNRCYIIAHPGLGLRSFWNGFCTESQKVACLGTGSKNWQLTLISRELNDEVEDPLPYGEEDVIAEEALPHGNVERQAPISVTREGTNSTETLDEQAVRSASQSPDAQAQQQEALLSYEQMKDLATQVLSEKCGGENVDLQSMGALVTWLLPDAPDLTNNLDVQGWYLLFLNRYTHTSNLRVRQQQAAQVGVADWIWEACVVTVVLEKAPEKFPEGPECCICYNDYDSERPRITIPSCSHGVCTTCLRRILFQSTPGVRARCPICKVPVEPLEVVTTALLL